MVSERSERDFVDPAMLGRLSRLRMEARFPMSGGVSGHHRSPHRGSSVEFAEYRKYAAGDDVRMLDWKVLARTDRYYLKEFEAETNLRAYLVLDCSASMKFGPVGATKFELARKMIATLAALAIKSGDAVGLHCSGGSGKGEIPARRNPSHLRNLHALLGSMACEGDAALSSELHRVAERVPRRSMILIFSDCFEDAEGLLPALQHLRHRKHDVVVFQMLAREEVEFSFDRPTRFLDLEGAGAILAEPALVRQRYLSSIEEHGERIREGCREFEIEHRRYVTDENMEAALAAFLIERAA